MFDVMSTGAKVWHLGLETNSVIFLLTARLDQQRTVQRNLDGITVYTGDMKDLELEEVELNMKSAKACAML